MIRARLFARLREQAGTDCEPVDLAEATVADVYRLLRERHPGLEPDLSRVRPARNQDFVDWSERVADGDEVAFIPPVSGGSGGAVVVEVTDRELDARRLEAAVAHPGAGAICTFTGVVRDHSRGEPVTHLEYEAYREMAERQMRVIADEIAERWPEARVAMVHRTGRLEIGEASVVVSVSCPHRAQAFEACRWGIDRLKESVPIWKKEYARSGAVWIEGAEARPSGG
ncbi:MAG TPA: molybdenum cofactor biosynthesis protein MoaE [Candidatus Dormibacteraeota bacterium]|nr:molybdenum cofactor biosynthesis protein MoaE [Candidatus Dormibacteraeota bacterium]